MGESARAGDASGGVDPEQVRRWDEAEYQSARTRCDAAVQSFLSAMASAGHEELAGVATATARELTRLAAVALWLAQSSQ